EHSVEGLDGFFVVGRRELDEGLAFVGIGFDDDHVVHVHLEHAPISPRNTLFIIPWYVAPVFFKPKNITL
ncbi:hypothetical protein A2U01_0084190, partial [Trifolium medium]|nr:hypothetical protein [Trifolium medium]